MARKDIHIPLDRENRNNHNDNYKELYREVDNIVGKITDEVYEQIIDASKINRLEPVNTFDDLTGNDKEGDARMVRDTGKVYRFDGSKWKEIEQIDASAINEVDSRLTQQLAETTNQRQDKTLRSMSYLGMGRKSVSPKFSIISDDFRIEDYTKLFPLMQEKGVKVGHGIITNNVGESNYGTWEQLKEMYDSGLSEVMSHSHLHRHSTQLDAETLDEDIKTSLQILRSNGYDPDGFVYPYNDHNEFTANIITKYYPYSFSKSSGGGAGSNYPRINNYAINRSALGSFFDPASAGFSDPTTLEYYKEKVDEAIENDNWLVFVIHTWHSDMTATQWQHLRDVIDYIRSKGYDIEFPSEGFDARGNIMQTSYYTTTTINSEGDLVSKDIQFVVGMSNFDINTRINSLNNQKVYVNTISSTKAASEGWPEGRAGTATTHRLSSIYNYNYQDYLVASSGNLYRRKTNSSHEWNSFQKIGGSGGGGSNWERIDKIGLPIEITSTDPSIPTSIPLTENYTKHIYAVEFLIGHNDGRNSQFVQFQGYTSSSSGSLLIGARQGNIYSIRKIKGATSDSVGFYNVSKIGESPVAPVFISKVYVVRRV